MAYSKLLAALLLNALACTVHWTPALIFTVNMHCVPMLGRCDLAFKKRYINQEQVHVNSDQNN